MIQVGVQISRLEKRIDNSSTDSTPNLSLQNDADTKSSSKSTNGLRTVSPEGFNLELPSTDNGHSSVFDRKKKPLILNSPHDTGVQTNCSKSNEVRSNMIFVGNETNEGKSLQVQNTQDDLKEVARTQEGNSQILVPQGPLEYRLPRPQVPFDLIPANDHVDGSPYVRILTNHGKEEAADGGYNLEKKGTSEIPSADAVSLLNRPDLIGKPLAVTGPASVQRPRGMDTWLEDSKGAYLEKGILTCAKANSIVNSSREEICQQISLSQRIREDEESGTSEHQVRNGQFVSKEQRLHIGKNIDSEQHLCNQWKENNIEMEDGAKCRKDMTDGARNEDDVSMVVSVGSCQLFNPLAEIASCSYEAREFGVGKGMLLSKAKELCPHLHTVAYDFEGYHRVSKLFYETVASFTSNIEAISCDELYIDVTKTLMETGASPLEFAQLVKDEIFAKTQCTASVGIGSNTLLAKICTQRAKPNGIYLLEEDKVDEFMKRLPVTELKGVGEVTNNKLKSLGISTCAELQRLSLPALQFHFGQKIGQDLYEHCRGQRDQPIRVERKQKVVSATINYGIRFSGFAEALKFVSNLAEAVQKKLKKSGLAGRTITLKLKVRKKDAPDLDPRYLGYGECDNKSRAKTLRQETDDLCIIQRETQNLYCSRKPPPEIYEGLMDSCEVAVLMSLLKKVSSSSKRIKSLKDMLIKKGSEVKKTPSLIAKRSEVTEPSEMVARKAEAKHFPSSAEKSSTYTNVTTVFQTEQPSSVLHDTANGKLEPVKSPNKTLQLESGFDQQFGHDHPQPASPSSAVVTQDGLSSPLLKPLTMFSPKPDTSKRRNLSTGDLPTENSSSLDPDVLKELPPDILREVLEEERSKVKKAENLVKTFGHVDDLPSFTEIDPTCLDALPAEILGELLSAYRRRVLASEKTPKKSPQNMFEIYKLREKQREVSRARKVRKCVKNSRGKSSVQRSLFEVMNIQSAKVKLRRHSALC
ncbi:alpha integrin binding protein 80 [Apostichopus japonicus]|uniref:Alpha integrin binding protein 80 n=1 Tax=Stichopus japonicus TaxID=307972 RepID=A0A2G8KTN7_STIJA|nr:alpha integrin binding protein 80 [Apostichopus japonicus]